LVYLAKALVALAERFLLLPMVFRVVVVLAALTEVLTLGLAQEAMAARTVGDMQGQMAALALQAQSALSGLAALVEPHRSHQLA
jgi:hypothetical protein